ncbi:MAG: hypothetical protein ACFFCD_07050 [Promethearchaeota archaeon]
MLMKPITWATGRRDVKPVESESSTVAALEYLNGIPYVTESSVCEAGSLTASAGGSSLELHKCCHILHRNVVHTSTHL